MFALKDTYQRHYFVSDGLTRPEKESAALGIYKEVAEGFEGLQSRFYYEWFMDSGFSEEDLPSDLIGFYMAVRGYTPTWIKEMCSVVDNVEATKELYQIIGGLTRSRTWDPTDYNGFTPCCIGKLEWPRELDTIKPSPKGRKWRDWTSLDDPRTAIPAPWM